jgi:hypothetical protein
VVFSLAKPEDAEVFARHFSWGMQRGQAGVPGRDAVVALALQESYMTLKFGVALSRVSGIKTSPGKVIRAANVKAE